MSAGVGQIGPGVFGAWRAGLRMLGRFTGLAAFLYAVQFALSAGAAWLMSRILGALFADRPLFDAAVSGDLAALAAALWEHPWLAGALAAVGAAAALAYAVLSWFLSGGLIYVLLRRPVGRTEVAERFGRGVGLAFFPYLKLALWALAPYAVCAGALLAGLAASVPALERALTAGDLLLPLAGALLPGVLLYWTISAALDYARIDLLRHEGCAAWRALLRGFRALLGNRRPLPHVLLYHLVFFAATGLYAGLVFGRPMAGAAGALSLFALRQGLSILRFAARFALIAGQVELSYYVLAPPKR